MSRILSLEDYTPASFVVQGNQVLYNERLLALGGKWNDRLKAKTEGGAKRQGWIFPMFRKPEIFKSIQEMSLDGDEQESKTSGSLGSSDSHKTTSITSLPSSVVITKSEFLSLVSRVERLETLLRVENSPTAVLAGSDTIETTDDPEAKPTRFKKNVKK